MWRNIVHNTFVFSSISVLMFSTGVFAIEIDYPIKGNNQVILDNQPNREPSILEYILYANQPIEGAAPLVLDDGTAENSIGDSGQFIWLNRFTPAPTDFPFQLEEVSVMFGTTLVNVGDAIEILIYEDTDNDGDPGTGAVLLGSINETIQFNDQATYSVYLLGSPIVLNGPGDVLIGVVNRSGAEGTDDFPAGLDEGVTAVRSWAATYIGGDVPVSPSLPGDEQWGTIDSFGFPGNWMIRGAGTLTDVIFRDGFE